MEGAKEMYKNAFKNVTGEFTKAHKKFFAENIVK